MFSPFYVLIKYLSRDHSWRTIGGQREKDLELGSCWKDQGSNARFTLIKGPARQLQQKPAHSERPQKQRGRNYQWWMGAQEKIQRSVILCLTPEVHTGSNVNEITLETVIFNSARRVVCIKKSHHNLSKAIYWFQKIKHKMFKEAS